MVWGRGGSVLEATSSILVTSKSLPPHSLLWVMPSCPFITGLFFFPVTESNPVFREGNLASSTRTFLKRTFIKHEFQYLNVSLVGTVAVSDVFDCTLECLSNPFCFSVNLAAFKRAHGILWCELLSSDKFRNSTEYKGNKSSHHFAIEVGNTLNFDN